MNLTQDPIGPLIQKLAIPASVGFFFNTMYNVVDTWYAGSLSTDALAALSIAFPVFFILIAISNGLSQGATALMAHALGAKKPREAADLSRQSVLLGLSLGVLLTGAGWMLGPSMFRMLGAEGSYLTLSLTYMNIIWAGTLFFIAQSMINAHTPSARRHHNVSQLTHRWLFSQSAARSLANAWRPRRAGNGHGRDCLGDGAHSGRRGVLPGLPRDGFLFEVVLEIGRLETPVAPVAIPHRSGFSCRREHDDRGSRYLHHHLVHQFFQ
ncbi:MAG: MATE family efflux transporter [Limisphaerales bacterium]